MDVSISFLLSLQLYSIASCILFLLSNQHAHAFSGSEYSLDTEYSGTNFFDGWDFYTGRDPTGGFVTYYSRSSSQLSGLIASSDTGSTYIGADYVNKLPLNANGQADGAGRPSVRISSKRAWTHGLFIGDFSHAPSNICGTWPAFWTLGPNWPYTGEVDIMEGVNQMTTNAVALHTNETCIINSNSSTQIGVLGNTNCAYYPDYNVGCGVVDNRPVSYSGFNSIGGGVYAMQWTSEYIRVWFFPRSSIPEDITNKKPDPSGWGLPAANMMGNCTIDQHFQQHNIVFDNTFCGEYAGNQYVWNSTTDSCAVSTGYATCDAYVANHPEAFRDAYWDINYVRVYQLVDPTSPKTEPEYIASLQAVNSATQILGTIAPAATPTASLCPTYNYTTVNNGGLTYEIMCDYDPPGPDMPPPYANYPIHSLEDCVAGCTYWNTRNGTNLCGAVAYDESIPFCYFKKYIDQEPRYRKGFAGARLIYYGYPQITDDPRSQAATSTSSFVEIIPTPQFYRPSNIVSTANNSLTSFSTTSVFIPTSVPPLGTPTNSTITSTPTETRPTVSFSGSESIPITNTTSISTPITSSTVSSPSSTASTVTASLSTSRSSITFSVTQNGSIPVTSSALIGQLTSTTTADLSHPTSVANFEYVGCVSVLYGRETFVLAESSPNMTIARCISDCSGSYYAGLYGNACLCSGDPLGDHALIRNTDSICDIPCPGEADQSCGGTVPANNSDTVAHKRQVNGGSGGILFGLLTLYVNAALQITVTTSSTDVSTVTANPVSVSSASSNSGNVIYSVTGTVTLTFTTIATTWCDYCPTCPGFLTTLATTITVPCELPFTPGAAPTPWTPEIPMMTTTRVCDRCGADPNGVLSTMTLTVPCETAVAALTSAASQLVAVQAGSGTDAVAQANQATGNAVLWAVDQVNTAVAATPSASALLSHGATASSAVDGSTRPAGASNDTKVVAPSLNPSLVPLTFTGMGSREIGGYGGLSRLDLVVSVVVAFALL